MDRPVQGDAGQVTGLNVDPLNPAGRPDPTRLREEGYTWVRLVSREDCRSYVEACQAVGIMVLACIARESGGNIMGGVADVYQIGNEPDSSGPASWTMTPWQYRDEWRIYRDTYPGLVMIAAGLASGATGWWQAVQSLGGLHGCSGMAVHPYAKTATQAKSLLTAYQALSPTLPIWVSEWHRPSSEVCGFRAMLDRHPAVSQHAWFCWSDGMVPGFGLTPQTSRMLTA